MEIHEILQDSIGFFGQLREKSFGIRAAELAESGEMAVRFGFLASNYPRGDP